MTGDRQIAFSAGVAESAPSLMTRGIVSLLFLSLGMTVLPALNIIAVLSLFPLRIFSAQSESQGTRLGPTVAIRFLFAAYVFWIFSYLLTTAPISNLFSFDFLRYDGTFLVGYLPLLLFVDVGLTPKFVSRLVWVFLGLLAGIAVLGALMFPLVATHPQLLKTAPANIVLILDPMQAMPLKFVGLYSTHMGAGNLYGMAFIMATCFFARTSNVKFLSWPGLILATLFIGMVLAGARTVDVGLAGTFLVWFVRQKKYLKFTTRVGTLVLVPALCFSLLYPSIFSRVLSIGNFSDSNIAIRFENFRSAAEDFFVSPLIGIGFGRYKDAGKTYSGIPHLIEIATGGEVVSADIAAHDSYLQFLAEGGVVGLFVMLGIWISLYRWAKRTRERLADSGVAAALSDTVQACVLFTFFTSFTGTPMARLSTPLFVLTVVGMLRNLTAYELRGGGLETSLDDPVIATSSHTQLGPAPAY